MTIEEKKAIQTIIIDEIQQHLADQPTLLVDALLADKGFAFLYTTLQRRAGQAAQVAQWSVALFKALNAQSPQQHEGEQEEVA